MNNVISHRMQVLLGAAIIAMSTCPLVPPIQMYVHNIILETNNSSHIT